MKVKQVTQDLNKDAKTAINNLERLIESASLLVTAVFSYLAATGRVNHLSGIASDLVIAACVVIGLRGAFEFIRYLANK